MQKDQLGERQKLKRLEILLAAEKEARSREWFEGKVPSRDEDKEEAAKDLLQIGLTEKVEGYLQQHPHPFRLTVRGRAFLENVRARIGENDNVNWQRLNEIEFPSS